VSPTKDQSETIKTILTSFKRIVVVGLSPDAARPSYGVTNYMIDQGYEIIGVRPGSNSILTRPCYSSLHEVPKPIEIVDVFRAPEHVPAIVDEAIACGAKAIWLQEGVSHSDAERKARAAGLLVVSDRCILKEHMRLGL